MDPAVNRLGHSAIAFIPVSYLVMIVLLLGLKAYMPWVIHPVPAKAGWLNVPFMAGRDSLLLLVVFLVYLAMVRWTLKADARARRGETIDQAAQYRLTAIAIAAAIVYVLTETILAYDFIMSLSPEWYSTMFAPYIWVTDMYLALAVLIVMASMLRGSSRSYLGPPEVQNLANLALAFSLLSMGLFFAQYLTIWYGNLPEETGFMIVRYYRGQWPWLGWAGFVTAYAIPFVLLQSRWIKGHPAWASAVSALIIIGVGLERYVLVAPSIIPGDPMFNLMPALSILGFLGAFVLAVSLFLRRYSPISAADVALCEMDEEVDRRMVADL